MSIVKNAGFLYLIKIVNLCSPLILIPFITYSLEINSVGKLFYYQSVAILGSLIVEYGFNLSGTRSIAQCNSKYGRYDIFYGVVVAKLVLIIPLLIAFYMVYLFTNESLEDHILLILAFASSFMQGISLSWYFHGLEKMKVAAKYDVFCTLIYLCGSLLLLLAIKEAYVVILMQVISRALSYSFAYYTVLREAKENGYRLIIPLSLGIKELKSGLPVFTFRIASSLYTKSTTIILGWMGSASDVALYSGAEKITKGVGGLSSPLNQAIFPNISKLLVSDLSEAKITFRKYGFFLLIATTTLSIFLFFISDVIVSIIFGDGYSNVAGVIQVLCISIPMLTISNLFGIQILLPLKKNKEFNFVIYSASLMHTTLIYFVVEKFGLIGAAWQIVFVETYVALAMVMMTLTRTKFWNSNV